MSEQTVAVIEKVTAKEGATNGKPWKKFSVKTEDGFYSTFDKAVAEAAHGLSGQRVELFWKPSGAEGQFKDLLGVKLATDGGLQPGAIPSDTTPDGERDWSQIGLRKTRCLLWAHYLDSPLAAHVAARDGEKPPADRVYDFGKTLLALAERDIYWREPATDDTDIPF